MEVWWAAPDDAGDGLKALLDPAETARYERYVRTEDRARFTVGVALTRILTGRALGLAPEKVRIDRTCPDCGRPHGAPRVEGGPYVSISHSGGRIGLAISPDGPVGLDVEALARREPGENIESHVLTPAERDDLRALPATGRHRGLLTYWTRKEALLKVTGDGLRVPMTELHVTGPGEPPALRSWSGHPDRPARLTLHTLTTLSESHLGCLAVQDQPGATVTEHPGAPLLKPYA